MGELMALYQQQLRQQAQYAQQQPQYYSPQQQQQYALQQQQYAAQQQQQFSPIPQQPQYQEVITLPGDAYPGKEYSFQTQDGRTLTFAVPAGMGPGMQVTVTY